MIFGNSPSGASSPLKSEQVHSQTCHYYYYYFLFYFVFTLKRDVFKDWKEKVKKKQL